jgi:hypothetical protein
MPDPANQGDRAKAYRLRKLAKRSKLPPVDALWLGEYDDKARERVKKATDVGGSRRRSGRRVKLDIEEHEEAEAVGTGAAAQAAAAALMAREEGRRLDSLTVESVGALKEAVATYREICLSLHERYQIMEDTHIELLGSVREQYLARTQAEITALEAANGDGDDIQKMAAAYLQQLLGQKAGVKTST